jgi:hypothetical protein
MRRFLTALFFAVIFALPALAQSGPPIIGPLQTQNDLGEIATNGSAAQLASRENLGFPSAAIGTLLLGSGCLTTDGTSLFSTGCGGGGGGATPGGALGYVQIYGAGATFAGASALQINGSQLMVEGDLSGGTIGAASAPTSIKGVALIGTASVVAPSITASSQLALLTSKVWSGTSESANAALFENSTWTGTTGTAATAYLHLIQMQEGITAGNAGGVVGLGITDNLAAGFTGARNLVSLVVNVNGAPASGNGSLASALNTKVNINANQGGTSFSSSATTNGVGFGFNPVVVANNGATYLGGLIGTEIDIGSYAGSSSYVKLGAQIVELSADAVQGYSDDIAFSINNQISIAGGAVGWKNGFTFGRAGGWFPMSRTGTMFAAIGNAAGGDILQVANVLSFSNLTITGYAWQFPGSTLDGSGNATFLSAAAATASFTTSVSSPVGTFATSVTSPVGAFATSVNTGVLEISGTPAFNLLANVSNPILNPDYTNLNHPDPAATYQYAPTVVGYSRSPGVGQDYYLNIRTDNLVLTQTTTNHFGENETSINITGTGYLDAELNEEKSNILVASATAHLASGESKQFTINNAGIVDSFNGILIEPQNEPGGTMGSFTGVSLQPNNSNTTSGSIGGYFGVQCGAWVGSGARPNNGHNDCIFSSDQYQEISIAGHYAAQAISTKPATSSGCGGSGGAGVNLDSRASDTAGLLTIGASPGATCVITLNLDLPFSDPGHVVMASPTNTAFTYATANSGSAYTITITPVSSLTAGNQFEWFMIGSY